MSSSFRLVGWNIRAGGGKRAELIGQTLASLNADVVVLSEFRSGPPSQLIGAALAGTGLSDQVSALKEVKPNTNAVMIAARAGLSRIGLHAAPKEPGRWVMAREGGRGIGIGAMHIPNQHTGRKPAYHDGVIDVARRWRGKRALLIGDTNSGRMDLDEEKPVFNRRTDAWFTRFEALGWQDGFRTLYPAKREYTWYSHRSLLALFWGRIYRMFAISGLPILNSRAAGTG